MPATNGVTTPPNNSPKPLSLPSRWNQVVRGDSDSIASPAELSAVAPDNNNDNNDNNGNSDSVITENSNPCNGNVAGWPKKAAWKKPSNGVTETVSPVMGASSWPALSESTKASPKSAESSKVSTGGSLPSPQGGVMAQSPYKQAASNAKSHSTTNHTMPARQRSIKRGGGGSGVGREHGNFTHPPPPPPPPFPVVAMPPNGFGNMMPGMADQSPREAPFRPVGGFGPQPPPMVNDHRHSSRRGNFGQRGDGAYHNSFGRRRDQDRGHYGNARDVHLQAQRGPPRSFVRPPPNTAAFFPQPMRPFATPMGFPDFVYIPTLPLGVPMMPHSPTSSMLMPLPEPPLPAKLVHQIEYYFSDANLIKDEFLKSNMDDQGWVSISLIAGFNRVKSMTNDIPLILESLKISAVLEVKDDKVRRRNDWMKWMPFSSLLPTDSGLQSAASSSDMLTNSLQKMAIDEAAANRNRSTVEPSANLEDGARCSSELTTVKTQTAHCGGPEDTISNCN